MLTTISLSFGEGSATSTYWRTSGPPNSSIWIAFIGAQSRRSVDYPACGMALTVVGSIAFDAVKTPFGEPERMLGGAAVHFSLAASFFTEVRPVGPVGDDFGAEQFEVLESRGIVTDDVERVQGGKSFFWRGRYEYDLNVAHTEDTQLGVFAEFEPKLSEASQAADTLFLANIQPDLQRQVRAQCTAARLSGLDSMNLWIETAKDSLTAAIREVDCLVVNAAAIRMLTAAAKPDPAPT